MVVAALVAFFFTYAALRDDIDRVDVAVVTRSLRPGEPLEPSMVGALSLPLADEALPAGLLRPAEAAAAAGDGAVIVGPVPGGSLLRSSDLSKDSPARPRAMAVLVERSRAVDGALVPGDVIDIVVVEQGIARFALVAVPVLAVSDAGSGIARGIVLTLEVDATASLRLAHALATGELQIVKSTHSVPAEADAVFPVGAPITTRRADD